MDATSTDFGAATFKDFIVSVYSDTDSNAYLDLRVSVQQRNAETGKVILDASIIEWHQLRCVVSALCRAANYGLDTAP